MYDSREDSRMARETISWSSVDVRVHSAAERGMPLNGSGGGSKESGEGGVNVAGGAAGRERGSIWGRVGIFQTVGLSWRPETDAGAQTPWLAPSCSSTAGVGLEAERVSGLRGPLGGGGRPRGGISVEVGGRDGSMTGVESTKGVCENIDHSGRYGGQRGLSYGNGHGRGHHRRAS